MTIHNERFMELTPQLGGMDPKALASFSYWNNPLGLKSWTMSAVELVLLGGAALALVHAVQALQAWNDPSFLCIWFAAIVYCVAIEIPIYFPERFGGRPNSVVFIHNEFSAGFFYGRTPLYILALYPALLCLAYVLVEQAGIFGGTWGFLSGAICVAFVHHAFYQVFDHLGPQLNWWIWDYEAPTAHVKLRSVPQFSLFNFSFVGPLAFALLARLCLAWYVDGRSADPTHEWNVWVLGGLTMGVGLLTTPLIGLLGVNLRYLQKSASPDENAVTRAVYACIAASGILALWMFGPGAADGRAADGFLGGYATAYGAAFLAAFAVLWGASLAEYRNSVDGRTKRGTPIGSLPYAAGCFAACLYVVGAAHLA